MEINSLHQRKYYPTTSSLYSFLFHDENSLSEVKTVKDNLNNIESNEYEPEDKRNTINFSKDTLDDSNNLYSKENIENKQSVVSRERINRTRLFDLKESTRKLLCLLDKLLNETRSEKSADLTGQNTFKPIQSHEDEGECSIYNRLTRKCQCLNCGIYNDFILLFNENVKHSTCDIGEIIKNVRILKKFLYMGDGYTRNALMFLKEGLSQSSLTEKVDIIQGVIHADICNIFEDLSIIKSFVYWPCKYGNYGDEMAQILIAQIVHKIASTEEGRRYLNFNSKITYDIQHALKKYGLGLNSETIEPLNAALNLLEKHYNRHINISFYCKPIYKGIGLKTLMSLTKSRRQITLEEVLLNLELLNNMTKQKRGKLELTPYLSELLLILKNILRRYNNSEVNIIATKLITNVISKSMINNNSFNQQNTVMVMSTATEPIEMKEAFIQKDKKKTLKKHMHQVKRLYLHKEPDLTQIMDKLKKDCKKTRRQIIVVPVKL